MARVTKAVADEKLQQAYNLYGNLLIKYCTVRLKDASESVDDCVQNTAAAVANRTSRLRTKIKSLINQVIEENGKGGKVF